MGYVTAVGGWSCYTPCVAILLHVFHLNRCWVYITDKNRMRNRRHPLAKKARKGGPVVAGVQLGPRGGLGGQRWPAVDGRHGGAAVAVWQTTKRARHLSTRPVHLVRLGGCFVDSNYHILRLGCVRFTV